jgi:hypothetical protein
VPLNQPGLGSIDTLLERYPPSVTFNAIPERHAFSVEIKGLRLKGQTTIDGVTYDLVVSLSEVPSGVGTITATRLTPDGGRFDSSFPVIPKLTFTEAGNPGNQVVIDCGLVSGCPSPLVLQALNVCWEVAFGPNGFDPRTKGITPIRAGIAIDGTYDGVNEYTTVGRKRAGFAGLEFHVGYEPTPPWNPCPPAEHTHASYAAKHVAKPSADCPATQTGTTGSTGSTGSTGTVGTRSASGTATASDDTAVQPADTIAVSRLCEAVATTDTAPSTVKKQPAAAKPRANGKRPSGQKQ